MSEFRPNEQRLIERCVGNREAIGFQLTDVDDEPIDLTGLSLTMRWVHTITGVAKVDDEAATIVDAEDGQGSYTPAAGDVDTAGSYAMYVQDNSTPPRRWPPEPKRWVIKLGAE